MVDQPATGILLAAGAGTRFGAPKADIVVAGARLIDSAVETLYAGGCAEVVAVVRPGMSAQATTLVVNPNPDRGLGSSLQLGLWAATGASAVLLLVDLPGVGTDAVRRVLEVPADVVVATYGGRRGHPVAIVRRHWAEVMRRAVGDTGARPFLDAHPELVVEVPCEGDLHDVDTPADLAAWLARSASGPERSAPRSRR
jgi:CTP:molybdopterin cytidylyltransferase MocA